MDQLQLKSQRLLVILGGCLNTSTIHESERELMSASNDPHFVNQLCLLIPSSDKNMKSLITSTLKNFMLARYNSPESPMSFGEKEFLRQNVFKIFYQIYPDSVPIKVYKEIMQVMILVDFPWQGVTMMLDNDLESDIVAGVYFVRQVAKANEYVTHSEQRRNFQHFIAEYFPKLENVVDKIFLNFNEQTSELLYETFKTLYSSFHIEIPNYLRNFANLERWIAFAETILNVPSDALSLKNQEMAARVYLKLFTLYASDGQDGKEYVGWANEFRSRYCQRIFQSVINLIGERKGNEEIMSTLIYCLYQVVKKSDLRPLFTSRHCEVLLYENCLLPLCQSNSSEMALFKDDPVEYVNREQDLTCQPLRRAILDFITSISEYLSYNNKSEMIRLVEYSAAILQSSTDPEKEVIIRILSKIGKQILKNKFLKTQFQSLTVQFFIPLLLDPSPLLNSLTCQLLSLYLPYGELDNQTVNRLMEIIYEKIVNNSFMVIRYNAILAFTALLNHRAALEAAAPHFSKILEIYVGMLNSFEHENLLGCLQSIVKHFSSEVIVFAPQLISHLVQMFTSLCKTGENLEDEDEPDSNSPASAAISTINQILSCQLSSQVYKQVSLEIIGLLRGIFGPYSAYFDTILSLFNVLVHQAKDIVDFNYPYVACRVLLEGDYSLLPISGLSEELVQELKAAEKADSEFQSDLLSILKNLIQKMPIQILKMYPYPCHPQLLLCMIQNQKFDMNEVCSLNLANLDENWSPYLQSYISLVYGVNKVSDPTLIRPIIGISLLPWLKAALHPILVRFIVNAVDEDDSDSEDFDEQNTAQMLEKYANEQDEEQQDYFQGSGIQYNYHYDSPFDSAKDKDLLIQQLRAMSQENALAFANSLSPKFRKRLEGFFA